MRREFMKLLQRQPKIRLTDMDRNQGLEECMAKFKKQKFGRAFTLTIKRNPMNCYALTLDLKFHTG